MIKNHITQRYPNVNPRNVAYRGHLISVCETFLNSGLADPNFVRELTLGQDSKFWSCISEALIFDRLSGQVFPSRASIGEGPDFLVMDGDRKVWIEVICPEACGVPEDWLTMEVGTATFPHIEILLRWTAAIKEKAEKLIGCANDTNNGYLQTGIVGPSDAYVIAVNSCQLRNGPFPELFGISQFPFAAEAVFPIGPVQLTISQENQNVVAQGHQHRPYIINRNNAQVPAYTFLDPRFNPISAIWAVDMKGGIAIGNVEPIVVVHNPNSTNPISQGFLSADSEYIATPSNNDTFLLEKIEQ
jgi:type I restriction enzyme S subunit